MASIVPHSLAVDAVAGICYYSLIKKVVKKSRGWGES